MCLDLQRIYDRKDGSIIEVPCRKCKRCLNNRQTDLAGRCWAEGKVSSSFVALTLTYADSNSVNSQVLVYRDIQLMMKSLRKAGHSVRYIVAGEYGSKRGRAHWHIILFFRGLSPELPSADTEKQMWSYWPHGFTYVQRPDYHGLMYVLKYAIKDDGSDKTTRRVMMSKKPPLGSDYWDHLAITRIDAGLPFALNYTFFGVNYKNKNPVKFRISGASVALAWQAHRRVWYSLKANKIREPDIAADDYDFMMKFRLPLFMRTAKPLPNDLWGHQVGWFSDPRYKKDVDYLRAIPYGFLVKTKNGAIFATETRRGIYRTWPVQTLAELVALARGRKSRRLLVVPIVKVAPF